MRLGEQALQRVDFLACHAGQDLAAQDAGGRLDARQQAPARRGGVQGVAPPIAGHSGPFDEPVALHAIHQGDARRCADVQRIGELALRHLAPGAGDREQCLPLHAGEPERAQTPIELRAPRLRDAVKQDTDAFATGIRIRKQRPGGRQRHGRTIRV